MTKKFEDLDVGDKFRLEGHDEIYTKVKEECREPYDPTNCENEAGEGAWVSDWETVEKIKGEDQ